MALILEAPYFGGDLLTKRARGCPQHLPGGQITLSRASPYCFTCITYLRNEEEREFPSANSSSTKTFPKALAVLLPPVPRNVSNIYVIYLSSRVVRTGVYFEFGKAARPIIPNHPSCFSISLN